MSDEWQPVGTESLERVVDRPSQMVDERPLGSRQVVVLDRLVQDGEVAGLLDVGRGREH